MIFLVRQFTSFEDVIGSANMSVLCHNTPSFEFETTYNCKDFFPNKNQDSLLMRKRIETIGLITWSYMSL